MTEPQFRALMDSLRREAEQALEAQIADLEALLRQVPPEAQGPVQGALDDARRSKEQTLARVAALVEAAAGRYR